MLDNEKITHFGTGTLIAKFVNENKSKAHVFLVTNQHVIPKFDQSLTINFKIRKIVNNKDSFVTLTIPIYNKDGMRVANVKTDLLNEDVCVILLDQYNKEYDLHELDTFLINYEKLLKRKDFSEYKIRMGSEIFFIGYPNVLYNDNNISPIIRRAIISSNPIEEYYFSKDYIHVLNTKEIKYELDGFLMDGNFFGGSSGSLVMYKWNPTHFGEENQGAQLTVSAAPIKNFVLGITTQSLFDIGSPEVNFSKEKIKIPQRVNIGVAISSDVIIRTIDLFDKTIKGSTTHKHN